MVDFIGFFNGDFLVFFFAPNAQGNDLQPQHEKSPPGFAQQKWQQKRHQRNFGAWAKSPQDICFETGKSQQPHCEETHEHPIVISSWHVLKASPKPQLVAKCRDPQHIRNVPLLTVRWDWLKITPKKRRFFNAGLIGSAGPCISNMEVQSLF